MNAFNTPASAQPNSNTSKDPEKSIHEATKG
jgi:hypothetical protein